MNYGKLIFGEVIAAVIPLIVIYFLLLNYISVENPPPDLSKTIFIASAPTLAILLTATTFIYSQFSKDIANSHIQAVPYEMKETLTPADHDALKQIESPLLFPRLLTRDVIRLLFLIIISTVGSGLDYFGLTDHGILVALTTLIIFIANLFYLVLRLSLALFRKVINAEDSIQKARKTEVSKGIAYLIISIVLLVGTLIVLFIALPAIPSFDIPKLLRESIDPPETNKTQGVLSPEDSSEGNKTQGVLSSLNPIDHGNIMIVVITEPIENTTTQPEQPIENTTTQPEQPIENINQWRIPPFFRWH